MKAVVLTILLLGLSSCQLIKKSGEAVCDGHHAIASGISAGGEYLGGPGNLIADIINATLEIGCRIFKATTAIPADIADGPEVTEEPIEEEVHHPQ